MWQVHRQRYRRYSIVDDETSTISLTKSLRVAGPLELSLLTVLISLEFECELDSASRMTSRPSYTGTCVCTNVTNSQNTANKNPSVRGNRKADVAQCVCLFFLQNAI